MHKEIWNKNSPTFYFFRKWLYPLTVSYKYTSYNHVYTCVDLQPPPPATVHCWYIKLIKFLRPHHYFFSNHLESIRFSVLWCMANKILNEDRVFQIALHRLFACQVLYVVLFKPGVVPQACCPRSQETEAGESEDRGLWFL